METERVIEVSPQSDLGHDSYDLKLILLKISIRITLPVVPSIVGASFSFFFSGWEVLIQQHSPFPGWLSIPCHL